MSKYFKTAYQEFIFKSRYARWIEDENRRETFEESVNRYINFMFDQQIKGILPESIKNECREAILNLEVMPSMRALMTAGKALERDNVAGFNCAYLAVDDPVVFAESLYILTCGTGLGFSVERQFVNKMPVIAEKIEKSNSVIIVEDDRIGWATALKELVFMLYSGSEPTIDYSKLRPAGARLKTFGGRSSGPGPLRNLLNFVIKTFKESVGERLNSIQCHDIMCKIAETIVVGGVRRSALISLSNLSDRRMQEAKSGDWYHSHPYRSAANNSVAYTEKPDIGQFMQEWVSLYKSQSGERGIFNRKAAEKQATKTGRRNFMIDGENVHHYGLNPCGEIILRSGQFCNLTSIIASSDDTEESLKRKARVAAILGTIQASMTDFRFLRKIWKKNTEEEALLGVSLNGIMDNSILNCTSVSPETLQEMLTEIKEYTIEVNKEFAKKIGINQAAAVTCVKPEGTTSQLVNCSSGIHPRHSRYFIRTVRGDNKDPMTIFLKEAGIPYEPDNTAPESISVFSFAIRVPDDAILKKDINAIDHLELWKIYKEYWCEHNPSITVSIKENEWLEVGSWVFSNFDSICGVAFMPDVDFVYEQAPYQEISKEEFEVFKQIDLDFSKLNEIEKEDNTVGIHEFACSANSCEIVDIGSNN
jgi:ribonucleoside-triphosphate reductase (thioredoxin)